MPAPISRRVTSTFFAIALALVVSGCGPGKTTRSSDEEQRGPAVKPITPTAPRRNPIDELCKKLKVKRKPRMFEVREGKIREVYLNDTDVKDISPLKGMPLTKLNLLGTRVVDISVLKTLDLNTLWLNNTKVTDLSPLKGKSLESLDITETPVSDLSALKGMTSLRRLTLSRSKVTDLTPLQGLKLQRIVFDPSKITKGLDAVRNMSSLEHMHTRFQNDPRKFLNPTVFWLQYRAGALPKE